MRGTKDPERRARLLKALRTPGTSVRAAAERARIPNREQVYAMAKTDPELKAILDERRKHVTGVQPKALQGDSEDRKLGLEVLREIAKSPKHKDRLKAAIALIHADERVSRVGPAAPAPKITAKEEADVELSAEEVEKQLRERNETDAA